MTLRPRLRFKLRTLLIALTLLALALGWHARGARQQRLAVETIFDHGGWAGYDFEEREDSTWLYADGKSRVPEWLLDAVGTDFFHSVVTVKLPVVVDPGITVPPFGEELRQIMEQVGSLNRLETLWLADNFANDQALGHVGRMTQIRTLQITDYGNVSPRGLDAVSHVPVVKYWSDYKRPQFNY